ncbi:PREDICTED: uncharacterized protein LOC104589407 isoform X2 [Nelumbo nucifera]|uniref:Uncharacterized protein LOC104589407 isoform X2 n=1 Tax=Nelumbo nucifera TaxID=4432 RepID=A0A1U7YZE2_NELNU|nr:PREDICTED: uncharacterized protein LOC104589407 isoform X2 [Nelumbo nucifera]
MSSTKANTSKNKMKETFVDLVFSWSLKDVLNGQLFKEKVEKIPKTFLSIEHYLRSYRFPLIEETHADLNSSFLGIAQAPVCEILYVQRITKNKPPNDLCYNIVLKKRNMDGKQDKRMYEPGNGDLIVLSDVKPQSAADLSGTQKSYILALVTGGGNGDNPLRVKVRASKEIVIEQKRQNKRPTLFAVYLINMTTNIRIWEALNSDIHKGNMSIIKEVLCTDSIVGVNCDHCFAQDENLHEKKLLADLHSISLNGSQSKAVARSIMTRNCKHKSSVKLIWGPPGTGKTKTVSVLLLEFLRLKCRTLTCAPTNIAVMEVISRLLRLVRQHFRHHNFGLGDIVLFGNGERMKIDDHDDLLDVFLDYRLDRLKECFSPHNGWKHWLNSMILLLEDPAQQYLLYLKSIKKKEEKQDSAQIEKQDIKKWKGKEESVCVEERKGEDKPAQNLKEGKMEKDIVQTRINKVEEDGKVNEFQTLGQFIRARFGSIEKCLELFIKIFCTHLPTSFISEGVVQKMVRALDLLQSLGTLLQNVSLTNEELEEIFPHSKNVNNNDSGSAAYLVYKTKKMCLENLRSLCETFSVPEFSDEDSIRKFCFRSAHLIFCTASSSSKLQEEWMTPMEIVVIDEAAQLKECESTIPLQLPGVQHAILIGDQHQLPAMISEKAEFGRSLFERLVALGHDTHLLNVQYRMHPSISLFPNLEFYKKQISDAPNVKERCYERQFLNDKMYGPYSFINISNGKEEFHGCSQKNMVEVAVASEIVKHLYKASVATRQRISVGVISPYKAQVFAIQEKLGSTYETQSDFSVSVRSVDGFQGGEEDVIIISTVRSNGNGSVGFLANLQRTNVALTRARYCLWILGNGETLIKSRTIWKKVVLDAKNRGCFFNADKDKILSEAIISVLIESGQLESLFNMDSLLFRKARWKVLFNDDFLKSMRRIKKVETQKEVISILMKLSGGLHHCQKPKDLHFIDSTSSQLLQLCKVDALLNLVWTVDLLKQNAMYIQVLKIWDVIPLTEIPNLVENLDKIFSNYTLDIMDRCKLKCVKRNLVVPLSWKIHPNTTRLMDAQKVEPVQNVSNTLASLRLEEQPNIPPSSRNPKVPVQNLSSHITSLTHLEKLNVVPSVSKNLAVPMDGEIHSNSTRPVDVKKTVPVQSLSSHLAASSLGDKLNSSRLESESVDQSTSTQFNETSSSGVHDGSNESSSFLRCCIM